jgi:hypothetical protein
MEFSNGGFFVRLLYVGTPVCRVNTRAFHPVLTVR